MTVMAEFVGGPLDGQMHELPDGRDRWYYPGPPQMFAFTEADTLPAIPEPLIYEKVGRRTVNTPTGEPMVRYTLLP